MKGLVLEIVLMGERLSVASESLKINGEVLEELKRQVNTLYLEIYERHKENFTFQKATLPSVGGSFLNYVHGTIKNKITIEPEVIQNQICLYNIHTSLVQNEMFKGEDEAKERWMNILYIYHHYISEVETDLIKEGAISTKNISLIMLNLLDEAWYAVNAKKYRILVA